MLKIRTCGCQQLCKANMLRYNSSQNVFKLSKKLLQETYGHKNVTLIKSFSSKRFVKDGMSEEFCSRFEKYGHYQPSALSLGQLALFGKCDVCFH